MSGAVIGYDGEMLVTGSSHEDNKAENKLLYNDLEALYIFGDKIAPRYTLKDGLKNIQKVMEYNFREKIWNDYIKKLSGSSYGLGLYYGIETVVDCSDVTWLDCVETEERKLRMQRLTKAMWYATNSFFTNRGIDTARHVCDEMCNPEIAKILGKEGRDFELPNNHIMDFAPLIENLNQKSDLMDDDVQGYGVMIAMAIECTKILEMKVLDSIKKAVDILEKR